MSENEELSTLKKQVNLIEKSYHIDKRVLLITIPFLFAIIVSVITFFGIKSAKDIDEYFKDAAIAKFEKKAEEYSVNARSAASSAEEAAKKIDKLLLGKRSQESVIFKKCKGEDRYTCLPKDCLAKCKEFDRKIATYMDVYSWAAGEKNECNYVWMLGNVSRRDANKPTESKVMRGVPMFNNRTTSGCGEINTGDHPRLEDTSEYGWDGRGSGGKEVFAHCACAEK